MEIEKKNRIKGHVTATLSIIIWGTTFISTKVLLVDFSPTEILFFRFTLAFLFLFILSPKPIFPKKNKNELLYAISGLLSVTLYFMFQNVGLIYTLASNAGVLIAVAPMFTAIVSYFMISRANLHRNFIIGFFITITGVAIISFNGNFVLKLNPIGDILIILGALSWGFYCNVLSLIKDTELTLIQQTRKIFFYGLVFLIPVLVFADFELALYRFSSPQILANILFLALAASAITFLLWNYSVSVLGPVKASTYIYFSPIVTVIASVIVLHEPFTIISFIGTFLIILGLVISEKRKKIIDHED